MGSDYREIEWIVHSDLVTRYANRLLKERDIAKLINSAELRFALMVSSLQETLYPYGQVWVGGKFSRAEPPSGKEHVALRSVLASLSSSSRYLSLHLFDVLEHRRPAIVSVISDGGSRPAGAPVDTENYIEVQDLYQRLSKETPTLVQWIQRSLSDEKAQHNLSLRLGFDQVETQSLLWSHVEFPARYCQSLYAREPVLKHCTGGGRANVDTTNVVSAIRRAAHECRVTPPPDDLDRFAKQLGSALNVGLNTEDAALIALNFYLWECSVGIMPYYLRGVAWNLPKFERGSGSDAALPAFLAVSCTAHSALGDEELNILDALTRGIASAITVCGIELAQKVVSHAYIPSILRHEVGNGMSHLTNRIRQFSRTPELPENVRAFHKSMKAEIEYLHWLIREVMDSPDPDREPAKVIYAEEESMWADVFSQMILRGKPDMDDVTLHIHAGSYEDNLKLTKEAIGKLAALNWPPPVAINRNRMRQLLAILVANALGYAEAGRIEIALAWDEVAPEYLDVSVWDDGKPYLPGADPDQRIRYGHKLIDRSMRALAVKYDRAKFTPPDPGAAGKDKVFRLTLPLSHVHPER
jgi:hypothetical protein